MVEIATKRILFVKEGRDNYGAERATLRLLGCLERKRLEPSLLLLEYSREPSQFLSSACDRDLAVFVTYSPAEMGRKLKVLSSEYDAIISIGYKCHILCWWYARRAAADWYAICHGWVATDLKLKAYNWLARFCLRSCKGVMTVSPTIEVPNVNSTVIYNGIDVESLRSQSEQNLDCLEGLSGKTLVVYVGRLEKEKGVIELVRAFNETVEGAELVIVGTGSLESELRQLAESNRSPVTFLGYQENPAPLIRCAACLVLPSSTEALPLVMLEAMALRTPVLATPVGAVPDIISDETTGYHLKSNAAADIVAGIERVLRDGMRRDDIVEKAFKLVSDQFSGHAVADRVCRFLEC